MKKLKSNWKRPPKGFNDWRRMLKCGRASQWNTSKDPSDCEGTDYSTMSLIDSIDALHCQFRFSCNTLFDFFFTLFFQVEKLEQTFVLIQVKTARRHQTITTKSEKVTSQKLEITLVPNTFILVLYFDSNLINNQNNNKYILSKSN